MPSLKELRSRKISVQSTRKITSAMKMVSAAKLRKAQEQVESGRPYSTFMNTMISALIDKTVSFQESFPLLVGRGRYDTHLLIVIASDRGLCGGFNNNIFREVHNIAVKCLDLKQTLKILCVGKRAKDFLKKDYDKYIIDTLPSYTKPTFKDAVMIADKVISLFHKEEIDICRIIYNNFISPLTQTVTTHDLIPFTPFPDFKQRVHHSNDDLQLSDQFIYEPSEEKVMQALLPRNIAVQIYRALMENAASEHGARMTAMDNATRNASDMIKSLELKYNRSRQAYITKELIEIISGAEAL